MSELPFPIPLYLDCNGSNPIDPHVLEYYLQISSSPKYQGNPTASHARYSRKALADVQEKLANYTGGDRTNIQTIFCSSATEANNLAILGMLHYGIQCNKKHIIISEIEHSSIIAPTQFLLQHGFQWSIAPVNSDGYVPPHHILDLVRHDTLLISIMQVNNETGIIQPIADIAEGLHKKKSDAYLHVDAAQGFIHIHHQTHPEAALSHQRIDMISISSHKMYAVPGIGALILKKRQEKKKNILSAAQKWPPLQAQILGGQQQGSYSLKGIRSGSIPLALALSLCEALRIAETDRAERIEKNLLFCRHFLELLAPLHPILHGDSRRRLPHVVNLSLPGIQSDSALLNLQSLLSASRASACSQFEAEKSKVLHAMGLPLALQQSAIRFSWSHLSPPFWLHNAGQDWGKEVVKKLQALKKNLSKIANGISH